MSERILQARADGILTLTLNQPERLNPVDFTILGQLADLLDQAAEDSQVRVVVLTGAGKAFCAGGDMQALGGNFNAPKGFAAQVALARAACAAAERLHGIPKPTIAMVRGAAAGGGLGLAAACDIRIASETAKFTYAYTKIGLAGDIGTSFFVRRLLGPAHAAAFCLASPMINAARALEIGLVNQVVADAELETVTYELARSLAAGPPLAMAGVKANLAAAESGPMAAALDAEAERFIRATGTADHREAAKAFLEKRKPVFTGS